MTNRNHNRTIHTLATEIESARKPTTLASIDADYGDEASLARIKESDYDRRVIRHETEMRLSNFTKTGRREKSISDSLAHSSWESEAISLAHLENEAKANWADFDNSLARFTRLFSPSASLATNPKPPLATYRKHGGIHFLRIADWSISVSRKRVTRVEVDVEERLSRLLIHFIMWPAICIIVILVMEMIGFSGR